jgi:hypothetical protein
MEGLAMDAKMKIFLAIFEEIVFTLLKSMPNHELTKL